MSKGSCGADWLSEREGCPPGPLEGIEPLSEGFLEVGHIVYPFLMGAPGGTRIPPGCAFRGFTFPPFASLQEDRSCGAGFALNGLRYGVRGLRGSSPAGFPYRYLLGSRPPT